jgi:hypothetical protein
MFYPSFYVGSGMKKCSDPGWKNIRIRDKKKTFRIRITVRRIHSFFLSCLDPVLLLGNRFKTRSSKARVNSGGFSVVFDIFWSHRFANLPFFQAG